MTLASASSAQMRYLEETTPGTIETGNPRKLNMTGASLSASFTSETSKNLRSDRQLDDKIQVSASTGGDVNIQLQYGEYDPFIEDLMGNTFNTTNEAFDAGSTTFATAGNTITMTNAMSTALSVGQWFVVTGASTVAARNGIFKCSETVAPTTTVITVSSETPVTAAMDGSETVTVSSSRLSMGSAAARTFTLETEFSDVAEFICYKGCRPSKLSLNFQTGSILGGSVSFLGQTSTRNATTSNFTGISGEGLASRTSGMMNAVTGLTKQSNGIGTLFVDGAPLAGTYIKSVQLNIDGKLREQDAIGSLGAVGVAAGTYEIGGTLEVYFANGQLYQDAIDDVAKSLEFAVRDSDLNGYAFTMPRIKLDVPDINPPGIDQDVMLTMSFMATVGTAADTAVGAVGNMLVIDRFGVDPTTL